MPNEFVNGENRVVLKNRKELSISGVVDVGSFDESVIYAVTNLGDLTIKGDNLKIQSISTEVGEMNVTGDNISSLIFSGEKNTGGGFFARIFR